jgi:hypothetical protein
LTDGVAGVKCVMELRIGGCTDHDDRGVLGQHAADDYRIIGENAGLIAVKVKGPEIFGVNDS